MEVSAGERLMNSTKTDAMTLLAALVLEIDRIDGVVQFTTVQDAFDFDLADFHVAFFTAYFVSPPKKTANQTVGLSDAVETTRCF